LSEVEVLCVEFSMEPGRPGRRLYADQPSFSSTLLDAIYKSMDEPGDGAAEAGKKREEEALHYSQCTYKASLAGSYRASSRPHAAATTSSSSDCSSYGGFSSSEAESSQHRRLRPVRTTGGGAPAAAAPEKKARPGAAIRAKLRDLRGKPASPGARLAGFLNFIFAGGKHHHRGGPASAAAESACSTASSSYSRSCLSKTPSTRGQPKRTVRFLDSDVEATTPASAGRRGGVAAGHLEQMLLRRMEMESDGDDEEDSSDASSDLFELENLAYRDELPVYETTRVVLNRGGIGHGHGRSTRVV
jgi:hypothetical protein